MSDEAQYWVGMLAGITFAHLVIRPALNKHVAPRFVAWCHRRGIGV